VFGHETAEHAGGTTDVLESPLALAGCDSLRAPFGRAYIVSLRERSAPFEFPPFAGCVAGRLLD